MKKFSLSLLLGITIISTIKCNYRSDDKLVGNPNKRREIISALLNNQDYRNELMDSMMMRNDTLLQNSIMKHTMGMMIKDSVAGTNMMEMMLGNPQLKNRIQNKMMHNNNNNQMMGMHNGMMGNTNSKNQSTQWVAPPSADQLKNLFPKSETATNSGKKIYQSQCAVCHGDFGKGDGLGGMGLNPKPAILTSEKVSKQSDGAIYWKVTTGKSPMPSYKYLSEQQRWQLVNYIRKLEQINK